MDCELQRSVALQSEYSLWWREPEQEILPRSRSSESASCRSARSARLSSDVRTAVEVQKLNIDSHVATLTPPLRSVNPTRRWRRYVSSCEARRPGAGCGARAARCPWSRV